MWRRYSTYPDRVMGIWIRRLSGLMALSLLLLLVQTALVTAHSLHIQHDSDGRSHEPLYIIVVAEAPDENAARMMALVIREVVRRPVHLYRGDDRIMIILTGYPIPLPDAEIIGGDLKHLDLFQDTPYPRFHPVQSIDYCDQTRRCLEVSEPTPDRPRPDI